MSEAAFSLKGNDDTFRERRHLHGRRVGRPLKSNQAELLTARLPKLRIDTAHPPPAQSAALFPIPVDDVWLEIGFGAGEHLLWQASVHPEIGFIGCEPFVNGVAKAVRGVDEGDLRNVRLYDDDARHLLDWLPPASIARVFVLFPDPWPKKRHRKRRILTDAGLALLARIMRSGAELRFATDIADYAEMVLEGIGASDAFEAEPGLLPERPADWPLTRYAEKAIAAARACQFFVFRRSDGR
jgi:tRNA (guanine-N7-)-methyltransferase